MLLSTLVGATVVTTWRIRETAKPLNVMKIVMPPLGMTTGLCMFFYPPTRIPATWGLGAFLVGWFILAYPLIFTTELYENEGQLFVKKSRLFLVILFALLAVRLAARSYIDTLVSPLQTGSIFYLLALGMIIHWRMDMFFKFRRFQTSN